MRKVLWIGDDACGSGFSRATSKVLEHMAPRWQRAVLGVNYRGDPHDRPYPLYPAWVPGGDILGVARVREIMNREQPDLVVMQTNPWNVPLYLKHISGVPVVGIIAVEGMNCKGTDLNGLTRAIFWNKFSQDEAIKGGMTVPSGVVPLGVDTSVYKPRDLADVRATFAFSEEARAGFIVANVNRNQYRKRIDLSIQYFAEWVKSYDVRDAFLLLHVPAGSKVSCDCENLAVYYGIASQIILSIPKDTFMGIPENALVRVMQAADIGLTTTLGEGHGLTTMEMMACGKPVIAGDFAALGEWAKDAAYLVPCDREGVMPDVRNMIGREPSRDAVVRALDMLYRSPHDRTMWGKAALERVSEPRFRWENIAARFAEEIERAA